MPLKLNCDLGESFGAWTMGLDAEIMPYIDQANIACGFHAGDPLVMRNTLALAKQHKVEVGAHPGYRDLAGFGRRSIPHTADELHALLTYQIAALDGMAQAQGLTLSYVKPHGALYNDMMANTELRAQVMQCLAEFHRPLKLMLLATADTEQHLQEAARFNLALSFEAFADRCYDDNGRLLPRSLDNAVHNHEQTLAQVQQLCEDSCVTTVSGQRLTLQADTLCVHGDNPTAVQAVKAIRQLIQG